MKVGEVDGDVSEVLLGKVCNFGDSPNLILRREFGIDGPEKNSPVVKETPFQGFLDSTEFQFSKGAVGRFLAALSWLYKHHSDDFSVIEEIKGRGRIYFSRSVEELKHLRV